MAEYGSPYAAELAAAHQAEALVRGDDPRFFGRQHVLLPEQLEDRRRHRRLAAVGVDFLAASGHQRAGRVEVPRDARRIGQPDTRDPAARSRWPGAGMFTHPSGASVSSYRTPPPKVTTMTRRSGLLNRGAGCAKTRRGSHHSARQAAITRSASRRRRTPGKARSIVNDLASRDLAHLVRELERVIDAGQDVAARRVVRPSVRDQAHAALVDERQLRDQLR